MLIELTDVTRVYGTAVVTHALRPTKLSIDRGTLMVILGPSGSGKTTLLNLIGGLDRPTSGTVVVDGIALGDAGTATLERFRRERVGYVFQFFNLFSSLTAAENILFTAELTGKDADIGALLEAVGLDGLGDRFPGELSGGQQQRVAIARALAKDPPLLLCDEPTGALDVETGRRVLGLLRAAADAGRTVLVVTHDEPIAAIADRVVRLRDGALVSDTPNSEPADPESLWR